MFIPEFLQALGGDGLRRAQLLREERDAQLLDHPAEVLELLVAAARVAVGFQPRLVVVPERLHGRGMLLVALRAGTIFLQAQRVAAQVARNVLEALPRRAREEAGIDETLALALHFLHDAPERGVLRGRLQELLARLADRGRVPRRRFGHGGQARLGALLLLLERLLRARRRVLADEGAVEDRGEEIRLQLVGRNRRVELERERVESREAALEGAQLLLEIQRHQPLHAFAMRVARLVVRVHEAKGYARALVHQRGKGGQRLLAAAEGHLPGQVAHVPRGDALAFHARLRLREREARGFTEAFTQLGEAPPHRELALRVVDDADV